MHNISLILICASVIILYFQIENIHKKIKTIEKNNSSFALFLISFIIGAKSVNNSILNSYPEDKQKEINENAIKESEKLIKEFEGYLK